MFLSDVGPLGLTLWVFLYFILPVLILFEVLALILTNGSIRSLKKRWFIYFFLIVPFFTYQGIQQIEFEKRWEERNFGG